MATHTPGPYHVGLPGGPAGPFWSLVNEQGNVVAMQITSAENAALLAASPDLLAVVEETVIAVESYGALVRTGYPSIASALEAVSVRLRGAVAKATGEASR